MFATIVDSKRLDNNIVSDKTAIIELLELYKDFPCLWNTGHKLYCNKDARNEAFQILLEKWKVYYPSTTISELKKKIEYLRGAYRRERNKVEFSKTSGAGVNDLHTPALWYYQHLSFLNEKINLSTEIIDNLDTPTNTSNEEPERKTDKAKSKRQSVLFKKQEELLESAKQLINTNSSSELTSADAFGHSVSSQLKELPKMQRCITEKLIGDLLFYAKLGELSFDTTINLDKTLDSHTNQYITQPCNKTLLQYDAHSPQRSVLSMQPSTYKSSQHSQPSLYHSSPSPQHSQPSTYEPSPSPHRSRPSPYRSSPSPQNSESLTNQPSLHPSYPSPYHSSSSPQHLQRSRYQQSPSPQFSMPSTYESLPQHYQPSPYESSPLPHHPQTLQYQQTPSPHPSHLSTRHSSLSIQHPDSSQYQQPPSPHTSHLSTRHSSLSIQHPDSSQCQQPPSPHTSHLSTRHSSLSIQHPDSSQCQQPPLPHPSHLSTSHSLSSSQHLQYSQYQQPLSQKNISPNNTSEINQQEIYREGTETEIYDYLIFKK